MFPMRRPPFDPNLGQPHKLPPTPTLRQLQMQAAHRGRGPGGWQTGGSVGPRPKLLPADAPWPLPPGLNYDFVGARRQQGAESIAERMANQARRRASRSPGGWQEGGAVDYASNFAAPWHRDADPSEALMAEREMLQQQLQQTTDEVMAQEILMQIREITKELEMAAAGGMANGGIASLMGI